MAHLALIYHSGFGHTKRVAETVAEGIRSSEAAPKLTVLTTEEASDNIDALDAADFMVWGCPTYMGGPSAEFKKFAEAVSSKWMDRSWVGKAAAGFTNSGALSGDKESTLHYFVTLASQLGMLWLPMPEPGQTKKSGHGGKPEDFNRVGASVGLMTQSDNADPEETPAPGDLKTAMRFGEHVAAWAARLAE